MYYKYSRLRTATNLFILNLAVCKLAFSNPTTSTVDAVVLQQENGCTSTTAAITYGFAHRYLMSVCRGYSCCHCFRPLLCDNKTSAQITDVHCDETSRKGANLYHSRVFIPVHVSSASWLERTNSGQESPHRLLYSLLGPESKLAGLHRSLNTIPMHHSAHHNLVFATRRFIDPSATARVGVACTDANTRARPCIAMAMLGDNRSITHGQHEWSSSWCSFFS